MSRILDEEIPLLTNDESENSQQASSQKERTPLPWRQFSILLLLQVAEPMTSQVIAPFLPQLIGDTGITDGKDSRVGYYVGLMHSLFYFTEACTIFHWSRLSDKIGRKPILLTGLFGLSLSMWGFGLSKTFWNLVISRCLNGALNGNIGVMKSMTIEMTDSTNIAQAYGILPITWALGMTLGPLIGGSLAGPAERFPRIFGGSKFLREYPYFLPCSFSATVTALSWLISFMFLKETVKSRTSLKQYLFGDFGRATKDNECNPDLQVGGACALQDDQAQKTIDKHLPFRALLTRPVLIAAGGYAMLALVDIAIGTVTPVFYALPVEMGGLSLDPPAIGTILAFFGISTAILQGILFTLMHDWLGAKTMFIVVISFCLPVVAMFPAINTVARVYGPSYYFVWLLVAFQRLLLIFANFSFGIIFMYIGAAAPNKESIGATNGIAQIVVSVMRAIGPAVVNSAFSLSIEKNIMGGYLAYWMMAGMVGLTLWVGYLLPKNMRKE